MKYQTATKTQLWNLVKSLQKQLADTQDALNTRNLDVMKEQEKVEDLEETVSIQKTLITDLEVECKGYFSQIKELEETVDRAERAYDGCKYNLQTTIDQLVDKNKELDETKNWIKQLSKYEAAAQREAKEAKEEAALLRKTAQKNGNEITDLKDEIKSLSSAEKMAWKQVEKANQRTTDLRDQNNNYEDRIADAKEICWTLYDSLLTEEEIKRDMITDLRSVIGFLHD